MPFQQSNEFVFERHLPVMPFLILDVPDYRWHIRLAHRECAVTLLPGKFSDLVGHPSRRICLDRPDGVGNRDRRRKLQEEMDMIFHPTNLMNKYLLSSAYPSGVRPQTLLHFRGNGFTSFFGAENNMHYVLEICVRQCVAPPALGILNHVLPALTRWANFSTRLRR